MKTAFIRGALEMVAPAGPRSRLSVLIFHRVLPVTDPLQPDVPSVEEFRARIEWVKRHFNGMPLTDGVRGLRSGSLPACPLAITFDDGYADNYAVALPVLSRLGLSATLFVATGYLDGGAMFNDVVIEAIRHARGEQLDPTTVGLMQYSIRTIAERRAAIADILPRIKSVAPGLRGELTARIAECAGSTIPRHLMMTSEEVAQLQSAGMEVGAHTVQHPILASLTADAARREIMESRTTLEHVIGDKVRLFTYPNGRPLVDYLPEHVDMVRDAEFEGAVSTARGVARLGSDPLQIPRFTPWDADVWRFRVRLGLNLRRLDYSTA